MIPPCPHCLGTGRVTKIVDLDEPLQVVDCRWCSGVAASPEPVVPLQVKCPGCGGDDGTFDNKTTFWLCGECAAPSVWMCNNRGCLWTLCAEHLPLPAAELPMCPKCVVPLVEAVDPAGWQWACTECESYHYIDPGTAWKCSCPGRRWCQLAYDALRRGGV